MLITLTRLLRGARYQGRCLTLDWGRQLGITRRCVRFFTAEEAYVAPGKGVKEALFTGTVLSFVGTELSRSCVLM